MSLIRAAVGRGGVNRPQDVRLVQVLLYHHVRPPRQPLRVDGLVSPGLLEAIEDVQRRVVHMVNPDGRVDPNGRTWQALTGNSRGEVSLRAAVGREGGNQPGDVRLVQALLNNAMGPTERLLSVDGTVGSYTIGAIEDFQRRVVRLHTPDGRVDPGGRTWAALTGSVSQSPGVPDLPEAGQATRLTEADFARAAATLRCEVACIKAVNEVEAAGNGFLPSGRPKILFEAHIFSRRTQHRHDATHPRISSREYRRSLYKGGELEYPRLEEAMALNRQAALESASWGRFQIMGFNYNSAGFDSVHTFVAAMFESEGRHLDAFVNFLQHEHLDGLLRDKRWAAFAERYNGPGYRNNQYDTKLRAAYERHRGH